MHCKNVTNHHNHRQHVDLNDTVDIVHHELVLLLHVPQWPLPHLGAGAALSITSIATLLHPQLTGLFIVAGETTVHCKALDCYSESP